MRRVVKASRARESGWQNIEFDERLRVNCLMHFCSKMSYEVG